MVLISYISTTLIPRIEFSRFIVFGFALMIISIANIVIMNRNIVLRILFITFFIFQIYLIPPYLYNNNYSPDYKHGEYREYYLPSEYNAVSWFIGNVNAKPLIAGDWTVYELLGSEQENVDYQSNDISNIYDGNLDHLNNYAWFVFRYEDLFSARINKPRATAPVVLSEETYNEIDNRSNVNKVYDNRDMIYYKIIKM